MIDLSNPLYFIGFVLLISIGASAFHALRDSGKIVMLLQTDQEKLSEEEQIRVDKLCDSAKSCHNASLVLSGILLALSTLDVFQYFKAPFGEIEFPKVQTFIGLYFLEIVLIIAMERYFFMAYPWMKLDKRRPPFNWIVIGFTYESKYAIWTWMYIPILFSSIALSIGLSGEASVPSGVSFGTYLICGVILVQFPKSVYIYNHLIENKLDLRGGSSTLSINLLYKYRLIRQFIYALLISYPIIIILPKFRNPEFEKLLIISIVVIIILFFIRRICGIKAIYTRIDKFGIKFGYPIESIHYK